MRMSWIAAIAAAIVLSACANMSEEDPAQVSLGPASGVVQVNGPCYDLGRLSGRLDREGFVEVGQGVTDPRITPLTPLTRLMVQPDKQQFIVYAELAGKGECVVVAGDGWEAR